MLATRCYHNNMRFLTQQTKSHNIQLHLKRSYPRIHIQWFLSSISSSPFISFSSTTDFSDQIKRRIRKHKPHHLHFNSCPLFQHYNVKSWQSLPLGNISQPSFPSLVQTLKKCKFDNHNRYSVGTIHTSSTNNNNDDEYRHFRQMKSTQRYELWMKRESESTKRIIESNFTPHDDESDIQRHNGGSSTKVMEDEIILAASSSHVDSEINKEYGPSGMYEYWSMDDNESGIRTYWRQPVTANNETQHKDSKVKCNNDPVEVLELNFNYFSLIGNMSLSVDETWVAYLRSNTFSSPSPQTELVVRHIPSGQGQVIPTSYFSKHGLILDNVEFGGLENLGIKSSVIASEMNHNGVSSSERMQFQTLYFTTLNSLGRPHAVYQCTLQLTRNGDSNEESDWSINMVDQAPALIFQEDDEEYFVSVQRSKGCANMIISSEGKISNEIHLVMPSISQETETTNNNNKKNNVQRGYSDGKGYCIHEKSTIPLRSTTSTILVKKRENGIQYYVDCDIDGQIFILAHDAFAGGEYFCGGYQFEEDVKQRRSTNNIGDKILGTEMSLFQTNAYELPLSKNYFGQKLYSDPTTRHHDKAEIGTKELKSYTGSSSVKQHRMDCNEEELFFIEEMDLFHKYLVLYQRSSINGMHRMMILPRKKDLTNNSPNGMVVSLPPEWKWATVTPGGNMYYFSESFSFHLESPIQPALRFDYNFIKQTAICNQHAVIKVNAQTQTCGLGAQDGDGKHTSQIHGTQMRRILVPSHDDVLVPLTIIDPPIATKKSSKSESKCILIGYGSYGENIPMQYDPSLIPLLKRGFSIAYAHTRGGGELGRSWYQAGRLFNKMNAVEDFAACACSLKKKYRFLFGKGFSAGGILVGNAAFLSNRNDNSNYINSTSYTQTMFNSSCLFDGVSLINAFLDVSNSMAMIEHFLTQHEWEEFGNPAHDSNAANYIAKYSPYQNIPPSNGNFPRMFIVGALDDINVPCWHSITFCLKVRNALEKSLVDESVSNYVSNDQILLYIVEKGGHHLHGRRLDVAALEAAFFNGIVDTKKCK